MKFRHIVVVFVVSDITFLAGLILGANSYVGMPNLRTPLEGSVIDFLYIGEKDTFLAKINNSVGYYKYKFSGKQPKVGKYQIIGLGEHAQRGLLPLPDLVEVTK